MDPITTAIIGAIAGIGKDAIKDSYNALKSALKKKFGETSDLIEAVDKLEKKPDSEGRKTMLQEEVEIAKFNDDAQILELAQELLKKLQSDESIGSKYQVTFQGEVKAAQVGDRDVQQNKFG